MAENTVTKYFFYKQNTVHELYSCVFMFWPIHKQYHGKSLNATSVLDKHTLKH